MFSSLVPALVGLGILVIGILVVLAIAYGGTLATAKAAESEADAVAAANEAEDEVAKMSDDEVMKEQAKWSRPG